MAGPVLQINHLKVAPEDQDALVRLMTEQLDANIATRPGFLSATLHRSRDGRHVVNVVRFASAEQLDAAHARPEFAAKLREYRPLILEAGPALYDVAAHRRAPDGPPTTAEPAP